MVTPATSVTDEILAVFAARGAAAYFGEQVSTIEHVEQAAHFARADGADDALVVAALLHDVGHLLHDAPNDIAEWRSDARHEELGSAWLARRFGRDVSDPVRLHVAAKRYLCATAPGYVAKLSSASVATLALQGGPMSPAQVQAFRAEPCFRESIRLRLWDDRGKVPGLVTQPLADYRQLIESVAVRRES